jgi:hypothetical protein
LLATCRRIAYREGVNRPRRSQRTLLVALLAAICATPGAVAAGHAAPSNSAVPTVTGPPAQGATLTATAGTWNGTATITYAYQWQRCSSGVTSCADIAGATAQTYVATSSDVGYGLRVRVTATNPSGQGVASSAPTANVISTSGPEPENIAFPVVTGTPAPGNTLTTSNGAWTGTPAPTFTYAWQQCDTNGQNCIDVEGVEGNTYPVITADLGYEIRAIVIASNGSGGPTTAFSLPSAVVSTTATAGGGGGTGGGGTGGTGGTGAAGSPVETAKPAVTGLAAVGATLTASSGTWTGTAPISYAYQWQRCAGGASVCASIAGATTKTYVVHTSDVGSTVRVQVTATNANGSASDTTEATAVVSATGGTGGGGGATTSPTTTIPTPTGPPASVGLPQLTGLLLVGATLKTTEGEWTSAPGLTFRHAWYRCSAKGEKCLPLVAHGLSYVLTAADAKHVLKTSITAVNPFGSTIASSEPTAVIGSARAFRLGAGRYSVPASAASGAPRLRLHVVRGRRLAVVATVSDRAGNALRGVRVTATLNGARKTGTTGRSGTATLRLPAPAHRSVLRAAATVGKTRASASVRVSPGR